MAIAKAIEAAIGKRQGQRTDKGLVQHFAQVPAGVKTREIAAEKAGGGIMCKKLHNIKGSREVAAERAGYGSDRREAGEE